MLELGQFHPGAQLDLVEHALKLLVGKALPPLGDGMGHPAQRAPRNSARQQPVAHFIQQIRSSSAWAGPGCAGPAIVDPLQRQDRIDRRDRSAAGQAGGGARVADIARWRSLCRPDARARSARLTAEVSIRVLPVISKIALLERIVSTQICAIGLIIG